MPCSLFFFSSILISVFGNVRMNKYDRIDKRIVDNVLAFAKRLSDKLSFLSLEDFQQELMLAVFKNLQSIYRY